jgi:hypothetical protein
MMTDNPDQNVLPIGYQCQRKALGWSALLSDLDTRIDDSGDKKE